MKTFLGFKVSRTARCSLQEHVNVIAIESLHWFFGLSCFEAHFYWCILAPYINWPFGWFPCLTFQGSECGGSRLAAIHSWNISSISCLTLACHKHSGASSPAVQVLGQFSCQNCSMSQVRVTEWEQPSTHTS